MLSLGLPRGGNVLTGRAGKELADHDAILAPKSRRILSLCQMKEPYLTFPGYFPVTVLIREFRRHEIPGYRSGNRRRCYRKCLSENALSATSSVEFDFLREFSRGAGKKRAAGAAATSRCRRFRRRRRWRKSARRPSPGSGWKAAPRLQPHR